VNLMRTRGKSSLKAVRRREGGQAIVEFALTVILLMLLMFAILELSIFIYTYSVLANAAKEGVRYAIVHGADNVSPSGPSSGSASSPPCTASSTNVTNVVNQTKSFAGFSALSTSNVNVFVCYLDGDNKLNSLVQVSVSYVYRPLFGFNWPSVTVYANSAGRIVF
jgi:Flp pilus assembly protein TadG